MMYCYDHGHCCSCSSRAFDSDDGDLLGMIERLHGGTKTTWRATMMVVG